MSSSFQNTFPVMQQEREFDKAFQHFRVEREDMNRNWDMYSGFDYGQWQTDAVSELRKANRHIAQYNIIRGKVEGLAGSIVKNGFELDFVPVDGETVRATRLLKGLFYSDKEMLDWDRDHLQLVIDGLIHSGVEEMYISDKYNPIGNIGFRRCMPGHTILDPYWDSIDSNDLKQLWKVAYLTPEEIKMVYGHQSERIDEMVMRRAITGEDYRDDSTTATMRRYNLEKIFGSRYRLVERHHIVETPKDYEIWIGDSGTYEIPDIPSEEKKDYVEKLKALGDGRSIKRRKIVKEYWVTTSCQQLDQVSFLEDRKSEIQIGRLPFFPWSAARINGRNSGMVDLLVDAQQSLNKRESLSDHIISNSAHGAMGIDPAVVNGDERKAKAIIDNLDKPNFKFLTANGALQSGRPFTKLIEKTQYQGEIYQEIERMSEYLNQISKVDETLEGRSSGSEDNASFFARRQIQSEIALTTLVQGLQQHWNEKGEAYMLLAQDLYSGPVREFRTTFGETKGESEVVTINASGPEQGELRDMPRHKVVVSKSPTGVTVRATDRAINSELLQRIPPEQQLYRATITRNIMNTLDMSDDDKQRLEESNEIEYALALERSRTEIMTLQAQQVEAEAMIQQGAAAQQQQAMMQQQGGVPQEQQVQAQPEGV